MKDLRLNAMEEKMLEENEGLIHKTIRCYISNPGEYGMNSYEDLVQIGRIGLCKAIKSYDREKAGFSSYAIPVIKNTILNELRSAKSTSKDFVDSYEDVSEKSKSEMTYEMEVQDESAYMVIENCGKRYGGIAQKGVQALMLMVEGYSCKEIGHMFGVDAKTITAWVSRARKKLKEEAEVLNLCQ